MANVVNNWNQAGPYNLRPWLNTKKNAVAQHPTPRNRTPESENEHVARLMQLAKLNVHGFGIVVREVPTAVVKILDAGSLWTDAQWETAVKFIGSTNQRVPAHMANYLKHKDFKVSSTNPDSLKKRFVFANMVRKELMDGVKDGGVCTAPLSETFAKMSVLGQTKGDITLFMAFKLKKVADAGTSRMQYKLVALGTYCTFSPVLPEVSKNDINGSRRGLPDAMNLNVKLGSNARNTLATDKRIAELDLMCSVEPGAGPALLSYMLGRIAQRKKAGGRKYKGVLALLATDAEGRRPMQKSLVNMGFGIHNVLVTSNAFEGNRKRTEPYYSLFDGERSWVDTVSAKLMTMTSMTGGGAIESCPLLPKSGRTYCA